MINTSIFHTLNLTVLIFVIISEPPEDAGDPPVAMETEPSAPASQAGAAYSE